VVELGIDHVLPQLSQLGPRGHGGDLGAAPIAQVRVLGQIGRELLGIPTGFAQHVECHRRDRPEHGNPVRPHGGYLKIIRQTHAGFAGRTRLIIETIIAVAACTALAQLGRGTIATSLVFPFFKELVFNLGWAFVLLGAFVIVAAGNAVNLTDGLDGLAIVPVMIAAASFGFISYLAGNAVFAEYLQIHYVAGTGELAVLCGAVIGASLGFLWFNAPPASVFMGDTGSLALGGLLGAVAVAIKHEIVLAIVGGLFVLEAISVIVQVVSFKVFGKRVFKMAPIHHHYEQLGWTESQIVIRFWIVSVVLALAGLATLKLR